MRSFRTLVKWVVPTSVSSSFVCLESFALSLLVLPPPCPNPCQRIPELRKASLPPHYFAEDWEIVIPYSWYI